MTEILASDLHKSAATDVDECEPSPMMGRYHSQAVSIGADCNNAGVECVQPNTTNPRAGSDSDRRRDQRRHFSSTATECRTIAPRCKLGPQRSPNSHDLETVSNSRQTNVGR